MIKHRIPKLHKVARHDVVAPAREMRSCPMLKPYINQVVSTCLIDRTNFGECFIKHDHPKRLSCLRNKISKLPLLEDGPNVPL